MPDITMCQGEGCEAKELCYRYKAKPTPYWQSFFGEPMRQDWEIEVKGQPVKYKCCEYFWLDRRFDEKDLWSRKRIFFPPENLSISGLRGKDKYGSVLRDDIQRADSKPKERHKRSRKASA